MTSEEVTDIYSMRDIVARYGFQPNRSGFICCPFHQGDRTPSLKVYEKDYYCHACGAHGDIFDFVMRMDDISFREAFQLLGGTYQQGERKTLQRKRVRFRMEKEAREEREKQFRAWHSKKLDEICGTLRLLDKLIPRMNPQTDEWATAYTMREINQYKYEVLAFGEQQEQEEMRELDE